MMPYNERPSIGDPVSAGPAPAQREASANRRTGAAHSKRKRPAKKKRSAKEAFLDLLNGVIPKVGDSPLEIVRKCVFMVALLVLIGSVSYLLNDMVIQPALYEKTMNNLRNIYTPGVPSELPPGAENYPFPEGMTDDFKRLYMENNDLRGYLIYESSAGLFDIEYPVLQSGDNDFYLNRDFYKKTNKQGALFFDYRNNITLGAKNKNLIIYGHNLSTGQMFTYLNKLITRPNKNYARSAATLTMNTIYEQATYKVFAVMVVNTLETDGEPFRYLRTSFSGDADFLNFVAEIRARSVYDYDSVDVRADDELLMLSTCNGTSQVHFDEGRTVIVARKVREGESAEVDTSRIDLNDDVIMPYAWYVNQGMEPHPYYTGGFEIPQSGTDSSVPATDDPNGAAPTSPSGNDTLPPLVPPATGTTPSTNPPTNQPTSPPTDSGGSDTQGPPPDTTGPEDTTGSSDTTGTDESTASGDTTEPTESTDPTGSTDPTESTEPTDPTEPAEPTDPTEPAEPTDPTEPSSGGETEPSAA